MKRSEMIKVIQECLPIIEKYPKLTGRNADFILRKIEEAGMLPPGKWARDDFNMTYIEYSWESEE